MKDQGLFPSFTFIGFGPHFPGMNFLIRWIVCIVFVASSAVEVRAAFSSLYIFGDTLSTTTNNADPGYYGQRYSNGRVWVEVLAERQGVAYDTNKNWSHYGLDSPTLVNNVTTFVAPGDAVTSLFVIWVNNADFVKAVAAYPPYDSSNLGAWTNAINSFLTNHLVAIQTLHTKGARTIIMPNAVDLTYVPQFASLPSSDRAFIRARVDQFNIGFSNVLNQARLSFTNLTIHSPDMFKLLDNVMAQPASYGLTNALLLGVSTDALTDPTLTDKSLNGPGTNYIFWDFLNPTSKFHERIADTIQQSIWPVLISKITALGASNRLDLINAPIGLGGFADGSTNLTTWNPGQNFSPTGAVHSVFVPASGPRQFYRLRFPFAWSWP